MYFGVDTHDAIVKFQGTEDKKEKEKIYEKEIRKAFNKLAENLIFIHGFASDANSFQVLKSDCVSLIIQTNKKNKIRNRHVSLENFQEMSQKDKSAIENYEAISSPEKSLIFEEDRQHMFEVLDIINNKARNDNEKKCITAVITLFKNIDDLELLNKRAVFVYLREISGLTPKQLSVSLSNIRRYYKDIIKSNSEFQFLFR